MIFLGLIFIFLTSAGSNCPENSVVEYGVTFETMWDRKVFPKQYPEWRPPASWSKLVGYTHNSSFVLFRKGKRANESFQQFFEKGYTHKLDLKTQGSNGIYDAFYGPPISSGVGQATFRFTTNGNHTKISMASKITPSPDWFVGVNSYDLCPHGRWMEFVHLDLEPLDGGTDQGLTFTSPNWKNDPIEPISVITSTFPYHPAGSFYYPELSSLPTIAQFTIKKLNEYKRHETFDAADSGNPYTLVDLSHQYNLIQNENSPQSTTTEEPEFLNIMSSNFNNEVEYLVSQNELPVIEEEERKVKNVVDIRTNLANKVYPENKSEVPPRFNYNKKITTKTPQIKKITTSRPKLNKTRDSNDTKIFPRRAQRHRLRINGHKKIPTGDAMAVIDDIVRNYQKEHRRQLRKRRREERKRRRKNKKYRPPRDCRVSEWSEWSLCSKTCGIGEQTRTRDILKRARRGGKHCPTLKETTWCGSARSCPRPYFNWTF